MTPSRKADSPPSDRVSIAVLDDYQELSLSMADWSGVEKRARIVVFKDPLGDSEQTVERLQPFDILCAMRERTPLPRSVLERLPRLKLIASTGMRNASIDLQAAKELGICVCGTGAPQQGTPVLTWALILALARKLQPEIESVRSGAWQSRLGDDLKGRVLGIVGLGRIGSRVAQMAAAFEMDVIAWSQHLTAEAAAARGARLVSKEELFRSSDVVTLHLVLSDRTRGTVGARELAWMKRTSYLVNTSRGALADEDALVSALREGRIAGAGLDVYATEPLPRDHPFRSLDNVLATPHIGFVTRDTYRVFFGETIDNVIAWLDGNPIRVLNP